MLQIPTIIFTNFLLLLIESVYPVKCIQTVQTNSPRRNIRRGLFVILQYAQSSVYPRIQH